MKVRGGFWRLTPADPADDVDSLDNAAGETLDAAALERAAECLRRASYPRIPCFNARPVPPPPTCATCQHWDPTEPPHRDAKDPRRRCGALSTGQDLGRAQSPLPVLVVPLAVSGPQTVAVYTPPAFTCGFHESRR